MTSLRKTAYVGGGIALSLLLLLTLLFQMKTVTNGLIAALARNDLSTEHSALGEPDRLHVFTLGTGSPQLGMGRFPPSNLVIAGDEYLLFDAGEGASLSIGELGLPIERTTAVFMTHWHSDHFGGLGQVLNQSWNEGRQHPVDLFGPEGVEAAVAGLELLYREDVSFRSSEIMEGNDPRLAFAVPHRIEIAEGTDIMTVFDRNGVVVEAIRVAHGHVDPAYGYRISYAGKVVVISGDTVATESIELASRGADLLLHENVNTRLIEIGSAVMLELGLEEQARRARSIVSYHTDSIEAAKLAQRADVKALVFTHLIPAPPNAIAELLMRQDVRPHFDGKIVFAKDLQHFAL